MINIAIDGPSGAGKSSIAKLLAKRLNYIHLDTGSMYRCVAYKANNINIPFDDEEALVNMLNETSIQLLADNRIVLDGIDVSKEIRQDEVSVNASKVSCHPKVRALLVAMQQNMAKDGGVIMDGRDIGTVVLKDAKVKIFLTASSKERAKRRYLQNKELGIESDIEVLQKEIDERDYQDTHRLASPLKKADDAIEIDSSYLSIEDVVDNIYKIVMEVCE